MWDQLYVSLKKIEAWFKSLELVMLVYKIQALYRFAIRINRDMLVALCRQFSLSLLQTAITIICILHISKKILDKLIRNSWICYEKISTLLWPLGYILVR